MSTEKKDVLEKSFDELELKLGELRLIWRKINIGAQDVKNINKITKQIIGLLVTIFNKVWFNFPSNSEFALSKLRELCGVHKCLDSLAVYYYLKTTIGKITGREYDFFEEGRGNE